MCNNRTGRMEDSGVSTEVESMLSSGEEYKPPPSTDDGKSWWSSPMEEIFEDKGTKRRYEEKAEKRLEISQSEIKLKKKRIMKRLGLEQTSKPPSESGSGICPPTPPRPRPAEEVKTSEEVKVLAEDSGSDTELNSPTMASDFEESNHEKRVKQWVETNTIGKPIEVKKRRVRRKRQCLVCLKAVVHLKRHYRQKHKQMDVSQQKQKDRTLKRRGYLARRCPFKDCGKAIYRFGDHVKRQHYVNDLAERKRLIRTAEVIMREDDMG